jgi:hypothetical protein
MKAEDSGKTLLHLRDRLDLQQRQPAVAVLVAAEPALLPGLLAAMQPRILGSLQSHWAEQFQSIAAVLSVSSAGAWNMGSSSYSAFRELTPSPNLKQSSIAASFLK